MLIRICLILAILAALAAGGLNFLMVQPKLKQLQADDKEQTEGRKRAETDASNTHKDLDKTKTELAQTKTTLEATSAERDKAVATATEATKRATQLTEDLNKTGKERDAAQADLAAYKATGHTPEQIVGMGKQYKALEDTLAGQKDENRLLGQKLRKTVNQLAQYIGTNNPPVLLPATLIGKVTAVDPKYHFVVLNIGEDQQVLERGELLVNRNGRLVAKVRVSTVQKESSVANVLPGWELGEVMEGDMVIPAYPSS